MKEEFGGKGKPAALLTEPLSKARDDDNLSLGMVLAHLMPLMVSLGFSEISNTLLHLTTPRR